MNLKIDYKNVKKRQGIFIWEADVGFISKEDVGGTILNSGDRAREKARQMYGSDAICFPTSGRSTSFYLWVSEIKEWPTQKNVNVDYEGGRKKMYEDGDNGNSIVFYDFSANLLGKKQLRINFTFETCDMEIETATIPFLEYNRSSSLYRKYIKSLRQITQTDDVVGLAKKITLGQGNYLGRAKLLYDWVLENINYRESSTKNNATKVLSVKEGNSREISFLYVALLRAVDVPARVVSGAYGEGGRTQKFHSWCEVYFEGSGWIPVDCVKKMFARLDSDRIIFSKGENILLERGPFKSDVFDIDNKKAFVLQPEIIYLDYERAGFFALKENKYLLVRE